MPVVTGVPRKTEIIVAWTWGGGWLADIFDVGYMDFAGSGAA